MRSGQAEAGWDCLVSSLWLLLMLVLGISRAQFCLLALRLAVHTVSLEKASHSAYATHATCKLAHLAV